MRALTGWIAGLLEVKGIAHKPVAAGSAGAADTAKQGTEHTGKVGLLKDKIKAKLHKGSTSS